jgi:hypothetical protein
LFITERKGNIHFSTNPPGNLGDIEADDDDDVFYLYSNVRDRILLLKAKAQWNMRDTEALF